MTENSHPATQPGHHPGVFHCRQVPCSASFAEPPRGSVGVDEIKEGLGWQCFRTKDSDTRPLARCHQFERDDWVECGLPDHSLRPVLPHRPFIVDHVVKVDLARRAILPVPFTHNPAQVFPDILSPSCAGFGNTAATTSRGETSTPPTLTGVVLSSPSLCRTLSTVMNSSPSPYLKVTGRRRSIWA